MTERSDTLSKALAKLGYDATWLEYGFVDEQFLQLQVARFRTGADPHTEHYRYAAFLRVLQTRTALDDDTLAQYVALAARDPEQVMGEAALIQLVLWSGLTHAQRAWLRAHPALAAPVVQRAFGRVANSGAENAE